MPEFHETRMGQRFYLATMPKIADSLEKIAYAIGRNAENDKRLINELNDELYKAKERILELEEIYLNKDK